jgi:transposase InsO family protein
MVDEITQWEIIGAMERISERFLSPLLKNLIKQFPFRIINFHSDNGSEYINKIVAQLLNKLMISQTKSRPRHSNDNGLVETKNGSVIRKHMGYAYIQQRQADKINLFYKTYFNPYLNFHRPSAFPTRVMDDEKKM